MGKLPNATEIIRDFPALMRKGRLEILAISIEDALEAGSLPGPYRDPFNRMLAVQARLEDIPLVSSDPIFKKYSIKVIW